MTDLVRKRTKIKGVRQITGDSDSTIHRKTKDGRLPCPHFIGRDRYWFVDEILEAVEAQITTEPEVVEGFESHRRQYQERRTQSPHTGHLGQEQ